MEKCVRILQNKGKCKFELIAWHMVMEEFYINICIGHGPQKNLFDEYAVRKECYLLWFYDAHLLTKACFFPLQILEEHIHVK